MAKNMKKTSKVGGLGTGCPEALAGLGSEVGLKSTACVSLGEKAAYIVYQLKPKASKSSVYLGSRSQFIP